MSLSFARLEQSYRKYNQYNTAALYELLGWPDLVGKAEWSNTCAIRMSLALIESGMILDGRVKIKAGPLKDRWIEPGQNRLSNWIAKKVGPPEIYPYDKLSVDGPKEIFAKKGIVSFMNIPSYAGGHIDLLLGGAPDGLVCSRTCFPRAAEIRFWKLD